MKTVVITFNSLETAAAFIKNIKPFGYRLNTLNLTLAASLSAFQLAVAVEQFGAVVAEPDLVA